jgi:cytosine/adenosine deaminase-related metal-dependent hydrolase
MPRSFSLRARYVFPVEVPPIADGLVRVVDGRIAAVGPYHRGAAPPLVDLGNAALLPGLVNAHTHLEFSHLDRPLGRPGMSLPEWIRLLVAHRRQVTGSEAAAVEAGLRESFRHGVTALGEIATSDWPSDCFDASPLDLTVFLELIGLASDRVGAKIEEARRFLADYAGRSWQAGLGPHAPYSVHPKLFEKLIEAARRHNAPVAFHLAESREELRLLHDATGPFRELLIDLAAWDADAIPQGTRPLDYLKRLARAPRALVIHGNYLDNEEIALLKTHRATMSLVYCPRTHAYFGHAAYPLARLLEDGVAVALGTDSRASNPDLSLLAEMRFLARRGDVSLPEVLRLGTLAGAHALGRESELGSLSPGKLASLCAVALPDADAAEPHELLLLNETEVIGAWRKGSRLSA